MRTPQIEDGYTRIANELLEAFTRLDASGSAWRVFMVVLRKTYGFQKKEDRISLSQFTEMSMLNHRSVCRGLNELVEKQVLVVNRDGYMNMYTVQKEYDLWGSVKPVTSDKNDTGSSVKPVTESSDKNDTYKRKKEIKKIRNKNYSKKNMSWNKKSDDYEEGVVDSETGELSRPLEEVKVEQKAAREKARENLVLVEELRGLRYTPSALNSDVKIYLRLLSEGWSPVNIIEEYLNLINSKFWKDEKKKGKFPGMNTVQFSLRNKQPK